jgi:hypothetical protein
MFQFFAVLAELFKWLRITAELRARRQLIEEKDRVDKELDDLEEEYHRCVRAGLPDRADRLLTRRTDLLRHRVGLPTVEKGPDVPTIEGHDTGDGKRNPT